MIKFVTRIWTYLIYAISAGCIILLIANTFVRVSAVSDDRSHGIIEDLIFGRLAVSAFFRIFESENLRRWKDSNELSNLVAWAIEKNGIRLIDDPILDQDRKNAEQLAMKAYNFSSKIPSEYLYASNPELPQYFEDHFVEAMKLWVRGLKEKNQQLIANGVEHYNAFMQWIQDERKNYCKRMW